MSLLAPAKRRYNNKNSRGGCSSEETRSARSGGKSKRRQGEWTRKRLGVWLSRCRGERRYPEVP
eukprot:7932630-Pyramimonas_sp.AAC.1